MPPPAGDFQNLNGRLSPTLECIDARIVTSRARVVFLRVFECTIASSTSPVPFTSRLEPEQGAYLKYVLRGTPSNVRVRATFEVYTGENRTGNHVTKIVDFTAAGSSSSVARTSMQSSRSIATTGRAAG